MPVLGLGRNFVNILDAAWKHLRFHCKPGSEEVLILLRMVMHEWWNESLVKPIKKLDAAFEWERLNSDWTPDRFSHELVEIHKWCKKRPDGPFPINDIGDSDSPSRVAVSFLFFTFSFAVNVEASKVLTLDGQSLEDRRRLLYGCFHSANRFLCVEATLHYAGCLVAHISKYAFFLSDAGRWTLDAGRWTLDAELIFLLWIVGERSTRVVPAKKTVCLFLHCLLFSR